ncbi:MAG: hypothetical protein PHS41_03655, partial [Victivallaceae bacterium]|nr:hypothetical protein [Victivallaceae bacterium]
ARALVLQPDFIVADEPVSALDVSVQCSIVNLIGELAREKGTGFLFISHDLAVVEQIADQVEVMYLGKIVESGAGETICETPKHPYTLSLLSAVPMSPRRGELKLSGDAPSPLEVFSGCAFASRCPFAEKHCFEEMPELLPTADGGKVRCFHPLSAGRSTIARAEEPSQPCSSSEPQR